MRCALVLSIFCVPLAAQVPHASIEGRVTNLAGDPLRKASVHLQYMEPTGPNAFQIGQVNFGATSDADGNFVFEGLAPGKYLLSVDRTGYLRASDSLALAADQRTTGRIVKLTQQSVIAGKITDEDGEPMPQATVQLHSVIWNQGRRQTQVGVSIETMADGTFVIGKLRAGRYYLSATDFRSQQEFANERPARSGSRESYITTYYPAAIDLAGAASIELATGGDVRGLEIRMRRTRMFRVSGRATHVSGLPMKGTRLVLTPANLTNVSANAHPSAVVRDDQGHFEFPRVVPGSYVLHTPAGATVRSAPMLGRVLVNVGNEDLENVAIQLGAGAEISGTFILEGVGPLTSKVRAERGGSARMNMALVFEDGGDQLVNPGIAKDDGTFRMGNIQPDRYRLRVNGHPTGSYVKLVRLGGQDITAPILDLTTSPGGNLEIVLSPNAAEVSGTVRNENGDSVQATLTAWQSGDSLLILPDTFRANGTFRLTGLAPGEYRLIAWEKIDPDLAGDPEFRKKFESHALKVTLRENSRENVDLKVVSRESIETEAAKVR
jgi:hypothetical protein